MNFEDLKITRQFINALDDAGISMPTDIQQKAIPPIRSGQDVIGIAQTGTGKTAAYLLPLLLQLKYAQGDTPRCLILVPTKELVIQVVKHTQMFAKYTDLRCIGVYGGIGPKAQIESIAQGVDIVVATPGRFLEIYSRGGVGVKKLKHLVLDEADRMMDMGFMPQLRDLFEVIPSKRQNLLFSATFPHRVEGLSEEFLLWPTRVEVTPESTPVETVDQCYYKAPNFKTKLNLLIHLLQDTERLFRVIIFAHTKTYAESIGRYLARLDLGEVRVIHSNKGQNSRINAMEDFGEGGVRILVSTDVSSRGIDIPEVSHVINFSVPRDYLDYVHRIGRTGRAFRAGEAITFVDHTEVYHLSRIEEIIQMKVPEIPFPEEVEVEESGKGEKQDQAREIDKQKRRADPDYKGAFHEKKKKTGRKHVSKKSSSTRSKKRR
ncbi:MAG: DEAD/DEAH box helicase [Flavobacteriales bacterium]|nr:DEAD/DEAH box helicase [Flavobacteriales bacterium]MDG1780878.1 DEAD/DEAH box helicase [Flavobacteriales bacterium]MDG2245771.1 DEAD/DEAH box helicase [Flavobacteriales bacterium]